MRSLLMRALFLLCCWSVAPAFAQRVLVLGDSLSAAHNLPVAAGWVSLLDLHLRAQAPQSKVYNASISGETSAGGQERIRALLAEHRPELLVLELGANDSLRGLSIAQTRGNLQQIIEAARAAKVRVLLVGIELPVNYGRRYREALRGMYAALATQADGFVPHLLARLGTSTDQFQADGLHPTAAAQAAILDTILDAWPTAMRRAP